MDTFALSSECLSFDAIKRLAPHEGVNESFTEQ